MNKKAITNQRTSEEIKERVSEIDRTVPDGDKFVAIMENEDKNKNGEATPDPEDTEELTEDEIVIEDDAEDAPENEPEEDTEEPIEESEEEEQPKPAKKLPPLEQRYNEAGQEAMILNSKNKKILETIEEAENLPEPTVEELKEYAKQTGADYDELDTFAQNLLRETLQNKMYRGKISTMFTEERNMQSWVKKVEGFLSEETTLQKYPELANLTDEFVKYATKKTHLNADLELLVAGFMWKTPKTNKKGSLLLPRGVGNGGMPKGKQPSELTEDDAQVYRTKDQKKYKELIKKKKFRLSL